MEKLDLKKNRFRRRVVVIDVSEIANVDSSVGNH
jgi:hypothetical protein